MGVAVGTGGAPHGSVERTRLLVCLMPDVTAEGLTRLFEALGMRQTSSDELIAPAAAPAGAKFALLQLSLAPEKLSELMSANPDVTLVLTWTRPETPLLEAMASEESPTIALHRWQKAAELILDIWRQNRRRTVVLQDAAVQSSPHAVAEALGDRLGIVVDSKQLAPTAERRNFDELHRLIAAQIVAQREGVREALKELEAAALPFGARDLAEPVDCDAILAQQQEAKLAISTHTALAESLQAKCSELQEENELLQLHLRQVQDELETCFLKLRQEWSNRQELEDSSAARLRTLTETSEALKSKYGALRTARKRLDKELVQARNNLAAAENTIRYMQRSVSWRLTRPLRVVRGLVRNTSKKS